MSTPYAQLSTAQQAVVQAIFDSQLRTIQTSVLAALAEAKTSAITAAAQPILALLDPTEQIPVNNKAPSALGATTRCVNDINNIATAFAAILAVVQTPQYQAYFAAVVGPDGIMGQ